MRTINLNGYIDEEVWYGDEITPSALHEALYGANNANTDDVRIVLNSYGGSCNAATRMFDDVRAYPGAVHLIISGTAASAASVLSLSADRVEMTPGSLLMIHNPSVVAWGNEADLTEAIQLLRACKESILNVYAGKSYRSRDELSAMMDDTTWMDANQALTDGFIDGIVEDFPMNGPENSIAPRVVNREEAEAKVRAWLERSRPSRRRAEDGVPDMNKKTTPVTQEAEQVVTKPEITGTPVAQLQKRLGLIMPVERRRM